VRFVKRAVPALVLAALATLFIPGPATLEFYDVDDLVYSLDFPGIDITLAQAPYDAPGFNRTYVCGPDLVGWLEVLVYDAGDNHLVHFMNNHVIVRGTPAQQLAIRSAIAIYRATIRSLDFVEAWSRKAWGQPRA
jgi:hypothetical protein